MDPVAQCAAGDSEAPGDTCHVAARGIQCRRKLFAPVFFVPIRF